MTEEVLANADLSNPEVCRNVHTAFDVMRAKSPAFRSPELGMVVVTGYDEVMEVLRDPDRFSSKKTLRTAGGKTQPEVTQVLKQGYPYVDTLINTDGPRHAFHASLIKDYLTASRVRALTEPITAETDTLLDTIVEGETVEFVNQISLPLTIGVLCLFTGVPRDQRDLVEKATDAEIGLLGAVGTAERNVENAKLIIVLQKMLTELVEQRRKDPADDLISHIVHTPPPPDLPPLTMAETVSILRGVVIGGNETTRGMINASVLALARDPELMNRINADENAFGRFIDEGLRHTSPVTMLFRSATHDTEIGGVPVRAGELIGVSYSAANHDPRRYACPHDWDIDRKDVRRHVAFGYGEHYCVGSPLGRLESRVALRRICDRFAMITLAPQGEPRFIPSFMVRNMESLPVQFTLR
jgi:cytochrome P450